MKHEFSHADRDELFRQIDAWVSRHSSPDRKIICIMGLGRTYSVREFAHMVKTGEGEGRLMLRVIEHAAARHSVEDVLSSFERAGAERAQGMHTSP